MNNFQKQDEWVEPLRDKQAKQGKDATVTFVGKFSKANCKAKWSFQRDVRLHLIYPYNLILNHQIYIKYNCWQEVFQGQKYKMSLEEDGFVHKLTISNPTTADMGKFTCDVNNITTSAYLDVEGQYLNYVVIRILIAFNH